MGTPVGLGHLAAAYPRPCQRSAPRRLRSRVPQRSCGRSSEGVVGDITNRLEPGAVGDIPCLTALMKCYGVGVLTHRGVGVLTNRAWAIFRTARGRSYATRLADL